MFKSGKNIHINIFDRNQAINGQKDEQLAVFDSTVDSKPVWSPKGTYLILIKAEKVLFLGGEKMVPIITIPQAKVTCVHMSPCERYVLTYSPKGDAAFSIWNFQLVELIRDFQAEAGEDKDTYKWSFDGNYLAKRMIAETTKDGGESKVKEGISVYELPSMQLLANEEGRKKSITIEGISKWMWAPHRNLLVYTCVYA
jgi:translation initiation factor 3 subunit B